MKLFTYILAISLVALSAIAQDAKEAPEKVSVPAKKKAAVKSKAKTKPPKEKVPDYSKGFALFYKLGLPDVAKAEYVRLNFSGLGISNFYGYDINMLGNGWLVKEDKKNGTLDVIYNCGRYTFWTPAKLAKEQAAEIKEIKKKYANDGKKLAEAFVKLQRKYANKPRAFFQKVSLDKDIKTVLGKFTGKKKDETRFADRLRWEHKLAGKLFIFALNVNAKGKKDDANRIVHYLFKSGDKRKIIKAGLNYFADSRYEAIYERFKRDHDWKQYLAGVEKLVNRIPGVWDKKAVIKILAERLKAKLAGPPPKLPEKDLTPEDRKLAKELADLKECSFGGYATPGYLRHGYVSNFKDSLWLLRFPEIKMVKNRRNHFSFGKASPVIEKIASRGVKSMPLLIALLKDNYLTSAASVPEMDWSSHSYSSSDDEEKDKAQILAAYNRMGNRPVSRSDIARVLLKGLLLKTGDRSSMDEADPEEFYEECQDLYKILKGKTQLQIAEYYLKNGGNTQKALAVLYMLAIKAKKFYPKIEKFLMASPCMENAELVKLYVDNRGKAAKPFLKKFIKAFNESYGRSMKLRSRGSDDFGNKRYREREKKRLNAEKEELFKTLEQMTSGKTVRQVLDKVASGKTKLDGSTTTWLVRMLDKKSMGDAIREILTTLPKTGNVETRSKLISGLLGKYLWAAKKNKSYELKSDKALWMKLLADKQEIPGDRWPGLPYTIARKTLNMLAMYIDPKEQREKFPRIISFFPKEKIERILRGRVDAVLDGKKAPPFPSAKKITKEQRKKLTAALQAAPVPKLPEVFSKLNYDEVLAVAEVLPKGSKLNAELLKSANRIVKVNCALPEKPPVSGGMLTPEVVRKLVEFCEKLKKMQGVRVKIRRSSCLEGVQIDITRKPAKDKKSGKSGKIRSTEVINIVIRNSAANTGEYYKVLSGNNIKENVKPDEKSSKADMFIWRAEKKLFAEEREAAKVKEKKFWQLVERLCGDSLATELELILITRSEI